MLYIEPSDYRFSSRFSYFTTLLHYSRNYNGMAGNFNAEAFALLAIALVFIALRMYSRILLVGFRKLAIDDYMMVLAGVRALLLPLATTT